MKCLNCNSDLDLDFYDGEIVTCEICGWRNELNGDVPLDIDPIIVKKKILDNYDVQIAFPPIDKSLLKYLPSKLAESVKTFLTDPKKLTKNQYANIFHNLVTKDIKRLIDLKKSIEARIEIEQFFKNTNFFKNR